MTPNIVNAPNLLVNAGALSASGIAITSAVVADVTGTEITFDATTSGDISAGIFFVNFNFGATADPSAGWQEYVAGAVENQSITVDIAAYGGTVSSVVVAQVGYNPLAPGDPEYSAANNVLFSGLIVPVVVSAAIDNTSPAVGDTLTGEHGIIVGGSPMTITQQWQLCDGAGANCVAITDETSTTYEVVSGDVGDTLKFQQTSTNSAGSDTATSAATAAVVASFGPTDIAGLEAWYRFDTGLTLTGATVDEWADQSGNGYDLVQLGGNAKPSRESDGTVRFESAFAEALQTALFTTIPQPLTVVMRMRNVTWVNNARMQSGNSGGEALVYMNGTTPEIRQFAGSNVVNTNSNLAANTYGNVFAIFNGTSSSLQVDGNSPVASGTTPGTAGLSRVTLSATNAGANPGDTQFVEVIVYSVALTAQNITDLNTYLDALPV